MNRRRFLGGAAAAAAAAATVGGWPGWLRRAFGDSSCQNGATPAPTAATAPLVVAAAWRRAVRAGRPLLVLVVPRNDADKDERGHAFGEYLNTAGDAALAPLARAEVVCATMDELRAIVPHAGDGDPLLILIGTDRQPPPIARLDAALPSWERGSRGREWDAQDRTADPVITRRIALLADWVAARLPVAPAEVAALAAEARRALRVVPPPGAYWARSSGCGTDIENVRDSGVDCGMGHVPARSQRFLYLFSIAAATRD